MHLPGDFVECGVNKGGYARMILEYVTFEDSGKRMFLFDTFGDFPTHISGLQRAEHIKEQYSYPDCLTRMSGGLSRGSAQLTSFPGRFQKPYP